jgi:hypothetical protein
LIETCFCDSKADTDLYETNFDEICQAIAESTSGRTLGGEPPDAERPPPDIYPILRESGKVNWFGGPEDTGVSPSEGLAFIYEYEQAPYLFLPYQPSGTTGLARRLDPEVFYIAMRWDYDVYSKEMLGYTGDDIAWCGFGLAAAMARCKIKLPMTIPRVTCGRSLGKDGARGFRRRRSAASWFSKCGPRAGRWSMSREISAIPHRPAARARTGLIAETRSLSFAVSWHSLSRCASTGGGLAHPSA